MRAFAILVFVLATLFLALRGSSSRWESWRSVNKRNQVETLERMTKEVREGMTYAELARLLGPPDFKTTPYAESGLAGDDVWCYYGPHTASIHFCVALERGRVAKVRFVDFIHIRSTFRTNWSAAEYWQLWSSVELYAGGSSAI